MFFGTDGIAGTPPPVLRLNGYGDHVFNNIPVVVTQFSYDLSPDVDYINAFVNTSDRGHLNRPTRTSSQFVNTTPRPTRVPTRTSINITLSPIYSRKRMQEFGLVDFAAGRLLVDKNGGEGGFI